MEALKCSDCCGAISHSRLRSRTFLRMVSLSESPLKPITVRHGNPAEAVSEEMLKFTRTHQALKIIFL